MVRIETDLGLQGQAAHTVVLLNTAQARLENSVLTKPKLEIRLATWDEIPTANVIAH